MKLRSIILILCITLYCQTGQESKQSASIGAITEAVFILKNIQNHVNEYAGKIKSQFAEAKLKSRKDLIKDISIEPVVQDKDQIILSLYPEYLIELENLSNIIDNQINKIVKEIFSSDAIRSRVNNFRPVNKIIDLQDQTINLLLDANINNIKTSQIKRNLETINNLFYKIDIEEPFDRDWFSKKILAQLSGLGQK